jgi:hypothetical protein
LPHLTRALNRGVGRFAGKAGNIKATRTYRRMPADADFLFNVGHKWPFNCNTAKVRLMLILLQKDFSHLDAQH